MSVFFTEMMRNTVLFLSLMYFQSNIGTAATISTTTTARTAFADCTSNSFRCPNKRCIQTWQRCNGHNDCGDHSDELFCTTTRAPPLFTTPRYTGAPPLFTTPRYTGCDWWKFQCQNKRCVDSPLRCNGRNDCGDNSDEQFCPATTRKPTTTRTTPGWNFDIFNRFTCDNGKKVIRQFVCDHWDDCGDSSDERGCHGICHDCKDTLEHPGTTVSPWDIPKPTFKPLDWEVPEVPTFNYEYDSNHSSGGLTVGGWIGIVIVAVILKVAFWSMIIYRRSRRGVVIVRRTGVVVRSMGPPSTINTNTARADEASPATSPPPYPGNEVVMQPPPYSEVYGSESPTKGDHEHTDTERLVPGRSNI